MSDLGRVLADDPNDVALRWEEGVITAVVSATVVKVKVGSAATGTSCVKLAEYTSPAVGHKVAVLVHGARRIVIGHIG